MRRIIIRSLLIGLLSLGTLPAFDDDKDTDQKPDGKGNHVQFAHSNANKTNTGGITYHGGPVMGTSSAVNVYYIWYGNWSGNSATTILTNLAYGLGGSP